jgi:N-acetylglutamate synthase-like GNAT family acetyltransferase
MTTSDTPMTTALPEIDQKPEVLGTDQTVLTTRSGFQFLVRLASADDEAELAGLFAHLTQEDLRYRFLSPLKRVGPDVLAMMTHVDHKRTESFLAFDAANGRLIANAMLAAAPNNEKAEVALAVDSDYKHRGISWTLLQHVMRTAKARGIKKLQSIEDRGHKAAIALEREIGFKAKSYPGDATLILLEADLQTL